MSEEIQAIDWGQPGRRDEYQFELTNNTKSMAGTGHYIEHEYGNSSISYGYYTDNYRSASLELLEEPSLNYGIRIHHRILLPDGTDYSEVLGTFLIDDYDKTSEKGVSVWNVSAYGTWLRLTADQMVSAGSSRRNTPAQRLAWIYEFVGEHFGALTVKSSASAAPSVGSSVSWELGDTCSSVLHAAADTLGATARDDDDGKILLIVTPTYDETTPIDYEFVEGKNCTLIPSYTETDTKKDKVNRVVFAASTEDFSASHIAYLPSSDPFGAAKIGRFVTHAEEISVEDGETEDELNDRLQSKAETYLAENSGSIPYVEFSHVGIPELRYGNCIRLYNLSDAPQPYEVRAYLTNMDLTLGRGMITKSKAKIYLEGTS